MSEQRQIPVWDRGVRKGDELVPAFRVGPSTFRLQYTPGLAEGLAAGDVLALEEEFPGYRIVERGGNFGVWLWADHRVGADHAAVASAQLVAEGLGGQVDGGSSRSIVLTIPASAGFAAICDTIERWVSEHPAFVWEFTNAYAADGETELGWWREG